MSEELRRVAKEVFEELNREDEISPSSVASACMVRIAFAPKLHELGYIGCFENFMQIAREFCRHSFDPLERAKLYVAGQLDMPFLDELQDRYPRAKRNEAGQRVYVYRDLLTEEDEVFNLSRMRKAAVSLLKHCDAFEYWCRARHQQPPAARAAE